MTLYRIDNNPYKFDPERLFCVGKRDNNPKRSFLFISKLLGKHLAVKPFVVKASGALLVSLKYGVEQAIDHKLLVIGFCETATALGMSVASEIEGSTYITSTREPIKDLPQLISFEETHSHAATHHIFSDTVRLEDYERVILVDDEITTGHSMLHLMESIMTRSNIRDFTILTILDWRTEDDRAVFQNFASRYQANVEVHAVISGTIVDEPHVVYHNSNIPSVRQTLTSCPLHLFVRRNVITAQGTLSYLSHSGRFGVSYSQIKDLEKQAIKASQLIANDMQGRRHLLVLGHGENIYIPSRVAARLDEMGFEVDFRTTSRTPIFVDGEIIRDAETFLDRGETYYFYNVGDTAQYDQVIMLADTPFTARLCDNLKIYDL